MYTCSYLCIMLSAYCNHIILTLKLSGPVASKTTKKPSNEAYILLLAGKQIDVSYQVNNKKRFRTRGGREGALQAKENLQDAGIGKLAVKKSRGSVKVCTYTIHSMWFMHHLCNNFNIATPSGIVIN